MNNTTNRSRHVHEWRARNLLNILAELHDEPDKAEAAEAGLADALLRDALGQRATDIHLCPERNGLRVAFRVDGMVLNVALIGDEHGRRLLNQLKTLASLDPVAAFTPQDARLTYVLEDHTLDLRLASAPCMEGQMLALRIQVPERIGQGIDEIGLRNASLQLIRQWLEEIEGMLIVTGPTANGKTTTLYSLLHELKLLDRSIITIEDPVEYRIDEIAQMQVNMEHGFNFAQGIKAMLRLDPDYLLVGEIRDRASARAAIEAASSGRALLTSMHSRDAVGTVTSLRNWGVEDYEIAALLQVAIGQRLVRTLCPSCRELRAPTEKERLWFQAMDLAVPDNCWHAVGCQECDQLGYRGRTGVFEVWRPDDEECELILAHADERRLRRKLIDKGYRFLLADAVAKAEEGTTSLDEIRRLGGPQHPLVHTSG